MPAGDRLWFRLVCRSWAAAGAGVAPALGEKPLPRGKVTRMHGPDAAASAARMAEVMVGSVEGHLHKRLKNNLYNFYAEGRHQAVLQWARAKGHT